MEHGTLAEQWKTLEQWWNNLTTPPEHLWNSMEYQCNTNVTPAKHPKTTEPYKTNNKCSVFLNKI